MVFFFLDLLVLLNVVIPSCVHSVADVESVRLGGWGSSCRHGSEHTDLSQSGILCMSGKQQDVMLSSTYADMHGTILVPKDSYTWLPDDYF